MASYAQTKSEVSYWHSFHDLNLWMKHGRMESSQRKKCFEIQETKKKNV